MGYNNVPIAANGDWIDPAYVNSNLGDNLRALAPFSATGDLAYWDNVAKALVRVGLVSGGLLYGGVSYPVYLAKPAGLAFLQNDNAGGLIWKTGGNALEVLRKNAANNAYEFAPIGAWAEAKRTADLTGVSSSETTVSWDGAAGQSVWKSSTRLTAPVAGDYELSANILFSTASAWRNYQSNLKINGVQISVSKMWSESNYLFTGVHPARVMTLAAGNYLEATVDNCNGDVHAGSWMQMKRVR